VFFLVLIQIRGNTRDSRNEEQDDDWSNPLGQSITTTLTVDTASEINFEKRKNGFGMEKSILHIGFEGSRIKGAQQREAARSNHHQQQQSQPEIRFQIQILFQPIHTSITVSARSAKPIPPVPNIGDCSDASGSEP
jgi:hypothetical protein